MLLSLFHLIIVFGKIGFFAFGGGNSMILLIEEEVVENYGWISSGDFSAMVGATFLFPGLTAVKLSGLIGYRVGGVLGLLCSVLALNLPGLILALLFFQILSNNAENPIIAKILLSMRYAAVAMIGSVLFSFTLVLLKMNLQWIPIILTGIFFYVDHFFQLECNTLFNSIHYFIHCDYLNNINRTYVLPLYIGSCW